MRARTKLLLASCLTIGVTACAELDMDGDVGSANQTASGDQGYIVVMQRGASARGLAHAAAAEHGAAIGHIYNRALNGFAFHGSDAAAAALAAKADVLYVELDQQAHANAKPPWAGGGGGDTGGTTRPVQVIPWGVARVGGPGDGSGKTAWIIDTGIDADHPDLNVDANRSQNFAAYHGKKNGIDWNDGNGHGTHVAGTIAAKDDGFDVVGVAAGATVVAVRVLDDNGSGSYSDVIAGVEYVAANGQDGDVANMSLGGPHSQALEDAVLAASAHVKFALAAGNESDDANAHAPGCVNGPNIYTVSAIDSNDTFAYFSNYGNPPVDYAAPGVSILSTWKGGGLNTISGTSMATPHVAGLLLLGAIHTDGNAQQDPDGHADPIAHR